MEASFLCLEQARLGLTVLERSAWLLRRQLDERGAHYLHLYLEGLGLKVMFEVEAMKLVGDERLKQVVLKDETVLDSDLLLVAASIRPNIELAQQIGLEIGRGVVVDQRMQTSDPNIFAVGDVCEYQGQVYGLWPITVKQARDAAINAVGGDISSQDVVLVTALKVAGVDLISTGQF